MKPVYEMAVMNVRVAFPNAQDARMSSGDIRFRDALREILWKNYCRWLPDEELADATAMFEETWEEEWKLRFIPDLWWIDAPEKAIHPFEIEDTHSLTQKKLLQLHDYWWSMDGIGWSLTLTVFDRCGLNPRPLDLTKYEFHMLPVTIKEADQPNLK
jgi:hypothetical protein